MPDPITVGTAVVSVVAAAISVWQARYAKRQAVAAEEQSAAAKVQADLAKAQLEQLKRSEDEEQAHQRWLNSVLAELRKPGGPELVLVAPGDQLHAEWALARGYVNSLTVSRGTAIILPAMERSKFRGGLEARMREARRLILTTCNANPGNWAGWNRMASREEWGTLLAAAQELQREGLVQANVSDNEEVAIRITAQGSAAVLSGTF